MQATALKQYTYFSAAFCLGHNISKQKVSKLTFKQSSKSKSLLAPQSLSKMGFLYNFVHNLLRLCNPILDTMLF